MIEIAGTTDGLVRPRNEVVEAPRTGAALAGDGQPVCLAVLRAEWTTLALVAAGPGAAGRGMARALVETARACRLGAVRELAPAGVGPAQVPQVLDELVAARSGDGRAVVTVEDPVASPASAPLVVAADKVLLLVRLGASRVRSIAAIVELVGRDRVLGCVLLQ
jgi:hypothetical protein